jgi:hypothetical protein
MRLQALDASLLVFNELGLTLVLGDSYNEVSIPFNISYNATIHTLSQDLPLRRLRTSFDSLSNTESIEEILHLHTTLALSQLVGNTKLRSAGVRLRARGRTTLSVLQLTDLTMLQAMVVRGDLILRRSPRWTIFSGHAILQSTLTRRKTRLGSVLRGGNRVGE